MVWLPMYGAHRPSLRDGRGPSLSQNPKIPLGLPMVRLKGQDFQQRPLGRWPVDAFFEQSM